MLDMIKWGTDYFIKCHPEKYFFYIHFGDGNIENGFWYIPEFINYRYPSYKVDKDHPGSEVSGEEAATFPIASILFREKDAAYSALLLRHTEEICEFADEYRRNYTRSVLKLINFMNSNWWIL